MKGIIYYITLFFMTCGSNFNEPRRTGAESVTAICERIIICDSLTYPSINMVVSFKNHTDKNVYMLMNGLGTGLGGSDKEYMNAGLMLETRDLITPIGATISSNVVKIGPDSVLKLFFIYSQLYPNEWKDLEGGADDQALVKLASSFKLFYHYNDSAYSAVDKNVFMKAAKGYFLAEDMLVQMNAKSIEHRCKLTTDDISEMVGGKVVIVDSLREKPKLVPVVPAGS